MKTCPACVRYLRLDEPVCPFCGAEMRAALAPRSPWLLGLGLGWAAAMIVGCDSGDVDPTPVGTTADSDDSESDTELPPLPGMSSTSPGQGSMDSGQDTIDPPPSDEGEGSTYAGPDETDSTGSTTGYEGDESTTHRADWGEGSTYAGPDETDTTGPDSGSGSGSGSGTASTGPG